MTTIILVLFSFFPCLEIQPNVTKPEDSQGLKFFIFGPNFYGTLVLTTGLVYYKIYPYFFCSWLVSLGILRKSYFIFYKENTQIIISYAS